MWNSRISKKDSPDQGHKHTESARLESAWIFKVIFLFIDQISMNEIILYQNPKAAS